MSKKIIPFNIGLAKAGKPILTRVGREVRILADNINDIHCLVCAINLDDREIVQSYTINGYIDSNEKDTCDDDLMIEVEEKTVWVNVYYRPDINVYSSEVFLSEDTALCAIPDKNTKCISTKKINHYE